ncbi:hypothetical protein F511_29718 [Dorcoceras hygrometricum]|uniref:Uncharacterized protein n=1 Tax=Dorcoceras hygrometricum TaxID=472368 RepID=A0A2Z7BNX2_9LAMI|nr:hypothetical protein F511_29718 [Dorcoceras hygrometricum]
MAARCCDKRSVFQQPPCAMDGAQPLHSRPLLLSNRRRRRPPCAAAARRRSSPEIRSGQFDVENPIVLISSGLLVQSDEGASSLVVDRIDESTAINREAPGS